MLRLTSLCFVVVLALHSFAHAAIAGRRDDEVVPRVVHKSASIDRVKAAKPATGFDAEKVIAEIDAGSLEFVVDPKATDTRVDAEFTVDGADEKDLDRREAVVKLYAERVADGTIVVSAMFPGKKMPRDAVKLTMRVPASEHSAFKSASGSLTIRGASGALHVTTKSGAIKVEGHTGGIDAISASGAIVIDGATEGVRANSASGAVTVSLAAKNDHPFDLESKSGAITMEVAADFDGSVRMTSVDGAVSVADPNKRVRTPEASDHSMTAELGAAATSSIIETSSGSIRLVVRPEAARK